MTQKDQIKAIQGKIGVTADGIIGPKTLTALCTVFGITKSDVEKAVIKLLQTKLGVTADGIIGPKTLAALCNELHINVQTPTTTPSKGKWPTQAEVRSGKSIFGKVGCEGDLVNITPAYPIYYDGRELKTIRVHKLIAEDVAQILQEVKDAYGLEAIHRLRLDQYAGSYNFRKITSGKSYSMHAWGIAMDWDANNNTYSMHKPKASLSKPECEKWWEIWEAHGATSLGRARDYDWMHVQFASL